MQDILTFVFHINRWGSQKRWRRQLRRNWIWIRWRWKYVFFDYLNYSDIILSMLWMYFLLLFQKKSISVHARSKEKINHNVIVVACAISRNKYLDVDIPNLWTRLQLLATTIICVCLFSIGKFTSDNALKIFVKCIWSPFHKYEYIYCIYLSLWSTGYSIPQLNEYFLSFLFFYNFILFSNTIFIYFILSSLIKYRKHSII